LPRSRFAQLYGVSAADPIAYGAALLTVTLPWRSGCGCPSAARRAWIRRTAVSFRPWR